MAARRKHRGVRLTNAIMDKLARAGSLGEMFNRRDQIMYGPRFCDKRIRIGFGDGRRQVCGIVHTQDEDSGKRRGLADRARNLITIHQRHAQVENHDVGLELSNLI